jgi:hypothetical protein
MDSYIFSQFLIGETERIKATIETGAAWEIWIQVELALALRAMEFDIAREVQYPNETANYVDMIATDRRRKSHAIEIKVESATNSGRELIAGIRNDITRLQRVVGIYESKWVLGVFYSNYANTTLRTLTQENHALPPYVIDLVGSVGIFIASV